MATFTHAESRHLYSWWWGSHISPKNSKWLQENLADMDAKVKLMIKLIEEDADSFARRAEMYYKKRPELMKLVEEFYRAYRALSERYDHATGALRQAHRTIAEAFPNQMPLALIDDSPSSPSAVEVEPHTPEVLPPIRAFVEPDDQREDAFSQSAHFHGSKRNGAFSEENDVLNSRRGLKQLNEIFASGEAPSYPKFAEGIRKGLNFQEEERVVPEQKINDVSRDTQNNEVRNKEDTYDKTRNLQDEASQSCTENQNLKTQTKSELRILEKSEGEIHRLQESLSRLEAEKEAGLLKYHKSMEKISNLEMEISHAQADNVKLKREMLNTLAGLESAEGRCSQLETEKQALEMEAKALAEKTSQLQKELLQKQDEMKRLKSLMQEEHIQHTQAAAALHALEKLHSESLEKLRLSAVESQHQVELLRDMELKKHSLEEDIHQVKGDNSSLKKELKVMQEELRKLNTSIQDEHLLSVQAEEALQSLRKVHSQSQEEIKILIFDLKSKVETLKDIELKKHSLEEEIQQLNERNENLSNQVLSSTLMIKNLEQEIFGLNETRSKLENEVEDYLNGIKALQKEVNYLKEKIANSDMRHQHIIEQIEAVGLNRESFQASIKELQDGNLELKELCRKCEDENSVLLEKLEKMEKVTEKNTLLETSLSDAAIELEGLREKIKALEECSESLNSKISDFILENHSLVLQLETTSKNMETLSEDNAFLGNSLSEANVELEEMRERLKSLEESSKYLLHENSNLQSEKDKLTLQVKTTGTSLEHMKISYAELEDKHLNLEQEKESTLLLVSELQTLLKLEKQEREVFTLSSKSHLATLTDMINLLRKEGQIRDEELENVQNKLLNSQTEAFMMQMCLLDSKENILSLGRECQKHVEASRLAERLQSQLETENLEQKKMIASILEHNRKLREGIQMVLNSLGIKSACTLRGTTYEADCQHILGQIKEMQNFISDILDENHILLLEKSVSITLLQQLGLDLRELNSERNALSLQCRTRTEQLLALNSEKNELLHVNEQLRHDIPAIYLREDFLKTELETLGKQLLDLMEVHKKLQGANCNLVEEKQSLEKNVLDLRNEIRVLEEENNGLFAEVMTLSFHSLILEKFGAERAMDLRACSSDLSSLLDVNNDLEKKLVQMIQKIGVMEAENVLLKGSAIKLEDCQGQLLILHDDLNMAKDVHEQLNHQIEQLGHQIETGRFLLIQKDLELAEVNQKLKVMEHENMKLCRDLKGIIVKFEEAVCVREELEKRVCKLMEGNSCKDKEITNIHEVNQMLRTDINTLGEELAVLRTNKEHLTSELMYEIKNYEEEVARLWNDIHISSVHVGIFEEKVLELIGECERLEIIAMVQRKVLQEQSILNNTYADELRQKLGSFESESEKLKDQLNAYVPLVLSLQSSTASLEHWIIYLIKRHGLENHSTHDSSFVRLEHKKNYLQLSEDPSNTEGNGILGLQKLQVKVEELNKALVEYWDTLMQENSDVNSKSAAMKIDSEVLTAEKELVEEDVQENSTIVELEEYVQETGEQLGLQSGAAESFKGTDGLMLKDIQLDHASCDVVTSRVENSKNDNQMLESCKTSERDFNNQMTKASYVVADDDMDYHQTEVEEEKTRHPSKLAAEKELAVYNVVVPRKVRDSHQEWNKKILECLAADAHRLSTLQKSVQELKRMLENSEKSGPSTNMRYDTVRWQLRETEEGISQLFDINSKLARKVEDCSSSSGSKIGEQEEVGNQRKRRISDRARRGSEKIGRLELELQRIQYILLKLVEEQDNRTKAAHRSSKVILRDYLYGGKESSRRRKGHLCSCVQTKTGSE